MPEIIFQGKNYKAKNEISITEGFVFIDGYKEEQVIYCSYHPFVVVSGESDWKEGKLTIKGE